MSIRCALKTLLLLFAALTWNQSQAQTATSTALTLSAGGNSVSSVSTGTAVTLTAIVSAASTTLTRGQVNFCDATATHCTDVHILGTAAITSAGKATLVLRPGPGAHSYKAVFAGTPGASTPYASSVSTSIALTVTGTHPSATVITSDGDPGNYTLTASVYGFNNAHSAPAPSGTASFIDATTSNSTLATQTLTASTSGPFWYNPAYLPAGNQSEAIVSGDFNNDGNADFAIGLNNSTPTTSIFLGDGNGGFHAGGSITGSYSPVLVADFNGDGKPDILFENTGGTPTLYVAMLGNGDGTFTAASESPQLNTNGTNLIAAGDFNGDGIPDFAAGDTSFIDLYLGKGDGTFTQVSIANSISTSLSIDGLVAGDFNNDGKQDLAIVENFNGQVTLYLGNGDGTFALGPTTSAGNQSVGTFLNIAAADFNGDGNLDIVTPVNTDPGSVNLQLAVLLGDGSGGFAPTSGSPLSAIPTGSIVQIGDFNGDGIPDIYDAGHTSLQDLTIELGNGDGTFTVPSPDNFPGFPCCLATAFADFNNDGSTDIVASDFYDGQAALFFAADTRSTASTSSIALTDVSPQQIFASYPGDSTYLSSQSTSTSLEVQTAAPTFNPVTGSTIGQSQSITLSSTTPGALFYYRTSHSPNWTFYTQPIRIQPLGPVTIDAYAVALNYGQSTVSTATYTVVTPNPTPGISTLSPGFARVGASALTLTLTGTGFLSNSTVYWGATALATQFTSATQLTAQLPGSLLTTSGTTAVTVQNPTPGGGASNALQFQVDSGNAASAPAFSSTTATVTAGTTASYTVTLPNGATNVSVNCLNLPAGAACSYTASSNTLSLTTSSTTPKGTFQIVAVFTETLPTTFAASFGLPLLLLPAAFALRRKKPLGLLLFFMITVSVLSISGCSSSNGGGGGTNTPPATAQYTSSATITLQVQ